MNEVYGDLDQALNDVSASSAGGSPFLLAYGATFLLTAILSFFLPRETVALIAMFQGAIALPVAFWLERRMGSKRMSDDNPLKSLSAYLAVSQALAIPALIVVYTLNAGAIPLMLAAIAGVHFLPYAWLHRTRIYLYLGVALAIGAFIIQLITGSAGFTVILFWIGILYWVASPLVYRHAATLVENASV